MLEFNERGSNEKSIPLQSNVNERLLAELKTVRDKYNQTYYDLQILREKVDSLEEENRHLKAKTSIQDQWDLLLRSGNETLFNLKSSVDNAINLLQVDTKEYVNNEKVLLRDSKENQLNPMKEESIESTEELDNGKLSEQNHTTNNDEPSNEQNSQTVSLFENMSVYVLQSNKYIYYICCINRF